MTYSDELYWIIQVPVVNIGRPSASKSLSARLMGLDKFGVASYLLTKYFSLASLTDDAIAVLENVEVGYYHDYQHRNKVEK